MKKIVVLGAGFAGHTAALYLKKWVGSGHSVTVVSNRNFFQYTPSLVWVGIDAMKSEKTHFPLAPIYDRKGIEFVHAAAETINVDAKTVLLSNGKNVSYDYLVVATGPHLNYAGTQGFDPDHGPTVSICTADHADRAKDVYLSCVDKMKGGKKQTIIIGTGHALSTCQGAAFEYIHNVHNDLKRRGVRQNCDLIWFTNEPYGGDFGMGGITAKFAGEKHHTRELVKWLMKEADIRMIEGAAPTKIEDGVLYWENTSDDGGEIPFHMSMLIPQFQGARLKYVNAAGEDVAEKLCNPAGFLKVDADYSSGAKPKEEWTAADWPATYQSPVKPEIFAAGIAFAPPHPISPPSGTTKSGVKIQASPPRTGMTSGIIGKVVAENVADLVTGKHEVPKKRLSMAEMPAACIASLDKSIVSGSALTMVLNPAVPDFAKYPAEDGGRNSNETFFDMGKGSAWLKRALHTGFIYKFKANPGWTKIPE